METWSVVCHKHLPRRRAETQHNNKYKCTKKYKYIKEHKYKYKYKHLSRWQTELQNPKFMARFITTPLSVQAWTQ